MGIPTSGDLAKQPILLTGFVGVDEIITGDFEIFDEVNAETVAIQAMMSGTNVPISAYRNYGCKIRISPPMNHKPSQVIRKAIFDYIETAQNGQGGYYFKAEIQTIDFKITCDNCLWERPIITGNFQDFEHRNSIVLVLANAILEPVVNDYASN